MFFTEVRCVGFKRTGLSGKRTKRTGDTDQALANYKYFTAIKQQKRINESTLYLECLKFNNFAHIAAYSLTV